MKIRSLVAAIVALPVLAVSAFAADMPVKARMYAEPVVTWTGPYLGIFGGGHTGRVTQSGCVGACSGGEHINVGLFGVQGGYDWQTASNIVWGVFAWVPVIPTKDTVPANPGNIPFQVRGQFQGIIGARLGVAMGNALPYVFAGPGVVHAKITGPFGSDSATHTVLAVGAGLEYRLARNWSVDLRYTYTSIRKETYNLGGGPEQMGDNGSNFTAGVNYRF